MTRAHLLLHFHKKDGKSRELELKFFSSPFLTGKEQVDLRLLDTSSTEVSKSLSSFSLGAKQRAGKLVCTGVREMRCVHRASGKLRAPSWQGASPVACKQSNTQSKCKRLGPVWGIN